MATQRKAKRKLSDISFEKEGAHVALTSKTQGGPANGHDYALVLKANNFSEEFVQKMQQVRVTMELPDFLHKFFGMYGDDCEILASMMGYEKPESEEYAEPMESYKDYIQSKMEAFEIMKSAHEADSLADVLSGLDETEYLAMLNDQERIEKAFAELEKAYKPKEGDMVQWNSSGGKAKGKIEHVMTEGTLGVPGTEFSINASAENPAALIRIYRDGEPTETLVGHKASTLTKIKKSLEQESEPTAFAELEKAYKPKVGDMVSWNSSGGRATGKVTRIVRDGSMSVPNTSFTLNGTEDNPAVMIKLYRDGEPTDVMVGHKAGTLSKVQKSLTQESEPAAFAQGNDTSTNAGVENIEGVSASVNKEELEKTKMEVEVKVETVEKAQFELVQKALDEQKVQLQKAMETIAVFEAEKKEAINKAKTQRVQAIVKDESKVQAIAKAALALESEDDFTAFLDAMQSMVATAEASELFVEKGASVQEETAVKESAVAKLLKAKQVTK